MAKKLHKFKIKCYDKENKYYGSFDICAFGYNEAFDEYLGYCRLLTENQFHCVSRFDFVSGGRMLFSFCSLRHIVKQHNLTFKI